MSKKIPVADRIRAMRAKDDRHEWLWGRIEADTGGQDWSAMDDWTFVNLLRQWVFRNVRRETRLPGEAISGFLDNDPDFGFYMKDAPDIFKAFEEDKGGVIGGGCCWSMETMFDAFEYNSAIIDCGQRGGEFTRISLLCEIYHDGDFMWVVIDPNYDFAVTDKDGRPISYFRLLAHLARREDDQVKFVCGPDDAYREIITYAHQQGKLGSDWTIRPGQEPERVLEDGRVVYKAHMSWSVYERNADRPRNYLASLGLPPKLIYFFTQVFGIYPPHSPYRQYLWERITNVMPDIGPLKD